MGNFLAKQIKDQTDSILRRRQVSPGSSMTVRGGTTEPGTGPGTAPVIVEPNNDLASHKTSADHDGRYYTEAEVDAMLNFVGLSDTPAAYTGKGGKIVAVKADVSGLEFVAAPAAANGLPTGGTNNQLLAKDGATDYVVKWMDAPAAANGLPAGGTAGQVLAKVDGTNYNAQWIDAPSGGGAAYLNIIDKPPINPSNWDDEFNDNTVSGWTWLNQGISAVAEEEEESFLKIRVPSQGAADLIRGLVKTCPTGNFQATLKFIDCSRYGSWPKLGIVIGESLSGKQLFCAFRSASSSTAQTTYEVFTNPNTRASAPTGGTLSSYFGFYVRTKVYLDDTTWKVEISYSTRGIAWNIFGTVSLDFTPTYIGVAVNNAGTPTSDTSYYFDWFRVIED